MANYKLKVELEDGAEVIFDVSEFNDITLYVKTADGFDLDELKLSKEDKQKIATLLINCL